MEASVIAFLLILAGRNHHRQWRKRSCIPSSSIVVGMRNRFQDGRPLRIVYLTENRNNKQEMASIIINKRLQHRDGLECSPCKRKFYSSPAPKRTFSRDEELTVVPTIENTPETSISSSRTCGGVIFFWVCFYSLRQYTRKHVFTFHG